MMTAAQLRAPDAALPSACLINAWLARALAGERIVYHRGQLSRDRSPASELAESEQRALAAVANALFHAAQDGLVHLVQRRNGPFDFSYLAIKSGPAAGISTTRSASPLPAAA